MELSMNQTDSRVHISISGDIDEAGAEALKSRFKSLNRTNVSEVTVDFSGVTYIGSAGIGKFLVLYKDMAVSGGVIRVENVSPEIHELFRLLKLDELLTVTTRTAA